MVTWATMLNWDYQIIDNAFYKHVQSISESTGGFQTVGRGMLGLAESLDASPNSFRQLTSWISNQLSAAQPLFLPLKASEQQMFQ